MKTQPNFKLQMMFLYSNMFRAGRPRKRYNVKIVNKSSKKQAVQSCRVSKELFLILLI